MNTHTELVALADNVHIFGIRFLPCGLYRLMGLPLDELVNHKCKASDLTNVFDDSFIERLCNQQDSENLIGIIDEFLIKYLSKHDQKIDRKILFAVDKNRKRTSHKTSFKWLQNYFLVPVNEVFALRQ
jgi:hypothetical protein